MKKATALTLAGLMAISSAASASMSRWNGFGQSSLFIGDVQDIWTLPAVVASNANATYFEFGNGGSTDYTNFGYNNLPGAAWGGAHMTLGPGVLGIWGGRPFGELSNIDSGFSVPSANGGTGTTPSTFFATPGQMIDLLYGFNVGENLILGVGINRATAGSKTELTGGGVTTVSEQSTSDFGISLGADIKGLGPIALLEIGLQFNNTAGSNLENDGTTTNKITLAGSDLDLRIGADIKGEKNGFQRIEIGVNTDALNFKSEPGDAAPSTAFTESKNGAMAWNLGWASGMSSDKGMGLGGFILSGLSQTRNEANNGSEVNKFDTSSMALAFVCAGEGKVKDWITARAGLSSNLWASNSTITEAGPAGATGKSTVTNGGTPSTTISTGLSLVFGDITIDGVLNQDLLYTGSYLVSGIPAGLFSQVSATWGWGGSKE